MRRFLVLVLNFVFLAKAILLCYSQNLDLENVSTETSLIDVTEIFTKLSENRLSAVQQSRLLPAVPNFSFHNFFDESSGSVVNQAARSRAETKNKSRCEATMVQLCRFFGFENVVTSKTIIDLFLEESIEGPDSRYILHKGLRY